MKSSLILALMPILTVQDILQPPFPKAGHRIAYGADPLQFGGRSGYLVCRYEAAARKAGDDVSLSVIDDAGHFELISPQTSAWPVVRKAVMSLVEPAGEPEL